MTLLSDEVSAGSESFSIFGGSIPIKPLTSFDLDIFLLFSKYENFY